MKHRLMQIAMSAVLLAGCQSSASAQSKGAQLGCGLHTIRGAYAYRTTGVYLTDPNVPPGTPAEFVGVFVFDGYGNVTGQVTRANIGGFAFNSDGAPAPKATYTLGGDCVGQIVVHFPQGDVVWELIVSDTGKSIYMMNSAPGGIVFRGEMRKQS